MGNIRESYVSAVRTQANHRSFGAEKTKKVFKNPINQFWILGIILLVLGILALSGIGVIPGKYRTVIATIMMYTIVSSGFCLLLGYAGLASLGSSCFVGIGAYCTFFCLQKWHIPYIVAILMALAISFIIGLSIGFISLRVQGLFLGIITLGLSEIIRVVLKNIYSTDVYIKSSNSKLFGQKVGPQYMFFVVLAIMLLCLVLFYNLMRSPTGRAMLAMKNSVSAAKAFGVNLLRYRVLAFILACLTASLTGVCYLSMGLSIQPTNAADAALSLSLSLNVLAAVIIGGYKSLWGTFGGVVFVFGLQSLLAALFPTAANAMASYMSLVIGLLMVVIVMFYPGGFYQMFWVIKFKIKALKEKRRIRTYGIQ